MSLGSGAVTLSTTPTITVNSNTLTLGGAISGSGLGLTKAGDGTLVLGGSSTYSGATTVSAGTLEVTGNIESSNVGINFGATMSGIGNAGGTVTLNSGGILSPGLGGTGTLKVNALIWNGAASATPTMDFTLSNSNNSSTLANVTNTFVKGSGVDYLFNFEDTGFFSGTSPTTYTLIDFGSNSGFSVGNFTYENLRGTLAGNFVLNANNLQFLVTVPEPAAWPLAAGVAALGLALFRRQLQRRTQTA